MTPVGQPWIGIALTALTLVVVASGVLFNRRSNSPRRRTIIDEITIRDGTTDLGTRQFLTKLIDEQAQAYARRRQTAMHNDPWWLSVGRVPVLVLYTWLFVVGVVHPSGFHFGAKGRDTIVGPGFLYLPAGAAMIVVAVGLVRDVRRRARWRRLHPSAPRRVRLD